MNAYISIFSSFFFPFLWERLFKAPLRFSKLRSPFTISWEACSILVDLTPKGLRDAKRPVCVQDSWHHSTLPFNIKHFANAKADAEGRAITLPVHSYRQGKRENGRVTTHVNVPIHLTCQNCGVFLTLNGSSFFWPSYPKVLHYWDINNA